MGNVTLPTPVFVAGGALCLLAGYLVGTVAGPEKPECAIATVASDVTGVTEVVDALRVRVMEARA